jgi:vacuolar-type H+-ATPase subunit H
MREIIQQVIATEAQAKQMIQAARAEAGRLLDAARKEARDRVEQARQEARIEAGTILTAATEQADQEKAGHLKRAAAEIHQQVSLDETTMRQAAEAAVRCVCGFG